MQQLFQLIGYNVNDTKLSHKNYSVNDFFAYFCIVAYATRELYAQAYTQQDNFKPLHYIQDKQ